MEVVSSAAAVVQLLAQAIELWQQINTARESVKAAPKVLEDTKVQASSLFAIMHEIECRRELHTPEIQAQVERISAVAVELHKILEAMALRQRKSSLRQGLHALAQAANDDAKLEDVRKRLEAAKTDLALQISLVHIGISGELRDNATNRISGIAHRLFLERNESWENANQTNGIIGIEDSKVSTTARVVENKALGNGQQKNLILAGPGLLKLLEV